MLYKGCNDKAISKPRMQKCFGDLGLSDAAAEKMIMRVGAKGCGKDGYERKVFPKVLKWEAFMGQALLRIKQK